MFDAVPQVEVAGTGGYAVVLRGDSMEPLLKRGMRLIVSVTQSVADGDLVYAQLKTGDGVKDLRRARTADGYSRANPSSLQSRGLSNDQIESIHAVVYVRLLR